MRYYFGPLSKQPTGTGIQWVGDTSSAYVGVASGMTRFRPRLHTRIGPERRATPLSGRSSQNLSTSWTGRVAGALLPHWATEAFDWRQICKRFYLAQLLCANVNFQLFNCSTPQGFVKDSGETLHVARASQGHANFRFGWNLPLAAVHFHSQPTAVVAHHRSPLGVAGVPPSVATVRGTAGPEPMAWTPVVSEKDSAVILPMALPGQVKLQWTLEVDPGRYLVVVTVGDRHVGFAAHLEVGGFPIFSGEWVEAGSFKSRCLVYETRYGAITVGQHTSKAWASGLHRDEYWSKLPASASEGLIETLAPSGDSPPTSSPRSPRSSLGPRSAATVDALAKGTRLVSIRAAAVCLAREVERERKATLADLSAKIADAQARADAIRQAPDMVIGAQAERELHRAHAKLAELQAQKALKLFSLLATSRRVVHPYVYLSGEVAAHPIIESDINRMQKHIIIH
ncbi:unnamed protein product [Effrenium voratum]|nr:unnamed protein product [Effrenium voratum]